MGHAAFTLRIKDFLKGEPELLRGFNSFLPDGIRLLDDQYPDHGVPADPQNPNQEPGNHLPSPFQTVIDFVNKVRVRFGNDVSSYKAFLDLMIMYKTGATTLLEVYRDLGVIFAGHDDLIDEFHGIVPASELIRVDYETDRVHYNKTMDLCKRMRTKLRNLNEYLVFLNLVHLYTSQKIHKSDLMKVVADLIGDCPLLDEFKILLKDVDTGKGGCEKQEENTDELVTELGKQITPSYRLIRKEHQIPGIELESEVLNNEFKCVSNDDSAEEHKSRPVSPTAEAMFAREDEMYEMDILISTFRAAIKHGEKLVSGNNEHPPLRFLSLIENLYGDRGMEAVAVFNENPIDAIAFIIPRLRQKLEELLNFRLEQRIFM